MAVWVLPYCGSAGRALIAVVVALLCLSSFAAATPISGCGTIASDTVWTADHVYVLNGCDLTVEAGATLTIQPGTVVKLREGAYGGGGISVEGKLIAEGTAQDPVVFTGLSDDQHGGDTNGDGPSVSWRGEWRAVTAGAGGRAVIRYAEVGYGGGNYWWYHTKGNLRCFDAEVSLDHVTLRDAGRNGLYAERCRLELTNSTIGSNNELGLRIERLPATAPVHLEGNTFAAPPGSWIYFDGNPHGPVTIRDNRSAGGKPGFTLEGTINGEVEWDNEELVLVTAGGSGGGLVVGAEATLRLAPGSVVKSPSDTGNSLTALGVLFADGTREKPIIFTSLTDDEHGGDTNSDGPSTGRRGDWSAVTVGPGGYAHISHAEILYGGWWYYWYSDNAGLRCDGGDAVLEDVTLRDNKTHAILARNAPVRIGDSRIVDNDHGVLNLVGGRVDARRNWWGDASGPHNDTANPGGTGAGIDDGVGFEPWLGTFNWLDVDDALFHDTETLAWATYGRDPAGLTVDIRVVGGSTDTRIASGLPATGTVSWNSRGVPDGRYELRATLRDAGSAVVAEATRTIVVNNSAAVVWHAGPVRGAETWAAGKIHVVEREVQITTGGAVTVPAGAIVKAAPETRIVVLNGGRLTVAATPGSPAILTSLADDDAGGDTNLDGAATVPLPGDWMGVATFGTGQLTVADDAEIRYTVAVHAGTVAADEHWTSAQPHLVVGDVFIPGSATLTIEAGAQVKFAARTGITVNQGGRLVAAGTADDPIDLTSERDDAVAGDTNRDGDATEPAPGDWKGILFDWSHAGGDSQGNIDHVRIRYAGGTKTGNWDAYAGAVHVATHATVQVSNSEILWPMFQAMKVSKAGDLTVTNCVLAGADRGVDSLDTAVVRLVNTTVDDCRIGIWGHGGQIDIVNSIISNSRETGVANVLKSPITIRYSDVWSAEGVNFGTDTEDPTGRNGNISADPKFVDAAAGDYRLDYRSPAIDAADGAAAPGADARGVVRYDDPRSPNTGTPTGSGAFADMGAYEFADNAPSPLDLVVTSVSGPTMALAGDTVTIRWTVRNSGSQTVFGPWHDAVNLVFSPDANPTVIPAGEFTVGNGVRLGPGQSYSTSAQVRVPGSVVGAHYWQVVTNTRDEVFEGRNHANNARASDAPVMLDLPELVVGGAALSRQFNAAGQEHWFKFVPAAGEDILVSLDRAGRGGGTELYVGQGYMPTRSHFDVRQSEAHAPDASAVVASTSSQTYYVLAYPASLPAGAGAFTIRAATLQFGIESVSPGKVGNGGLVTLAVHGGKLGEGITFEIVDSHGGVHTATSVFFVDSSLVYVTFDLTGLPPGSYDLRARQGSSVITLDNGVNVVAGNPGKVEVQLGMPSALRPDWTGTLTVDYANTGGTDVIAPLMVLNVSNARLRLPGKTEFAYSTVQLLGIHTEGPAGILPPGARGTVALEMKPTGTGDIDARVWVLSDPARPWDWSATKSLLRPSFVPKDAWEAIFGNFTAQMGTTVGEYQRKLADDATYLSRLGEYTHDVQRLLAFALNQAGLREIGSRYTLGAFGRGSAAWWEIRASEDEQGQVIVRQGGSLRFFRPDGQGGFRATPGDFGVLARERDGGFRLAETNGLTVHFNGDGRLDFVEDRNGGRVTASYTGGNMTALSSSEGDTVSYTYDANGRVTAVVDAVGRTTTYEYDGSGEHLVRASDRNGSTTWQYVAGQGAAREHAVQSVEFPDGSHVEYEYDERGRLQRAHGDAQAPAVDYGYGLGGELRVTDANGGVQTLLFNDSGRLAEVRDAASGSVRLSYDANLQLAGVKGPGGASMSLGYDGAGNPASFVGPGGRQVAMHFDAGTRQLASLANTRGQTTQHEYDAAGNLLAVTYTDGTRESFAYDSTGRPTQWTNARGATTRLTYGNHGLLVRQDLPGGGLRQFAYDGHRNLVSATDSRGTIQLQYDVSDRLTKITYPSGRFLQFTYDSAGRRTAYADQDGIGLRYAYDSFGRLRTVADQDGASLVTYVYDAAGRIEREDLGNGTSVLYDYDAVGQIVAVTNRAPDLSIVSRYEYTYDEQGRRTRMQTPDGEWRYTFDAAGQLTRAHFSSTNASIPDQELVYEYDASGNRVRTVVNGAETAYTTNTADQYVSAGSEQFTYDADGNLLARRSGSSGWQYTYDTENRLVSATGPDGSWSWEYDVFGNLAAAVHDGERVEYIFDPIMGDLVGEYSGAGTAIARYQHGLGLVRRLPADGSPAYYHFDALGSVTETTDSTGAVAGRYRYLPFGGVLSAEGGADDPFRFVGRWGVMSAAEHLSLMRHRHFDPVLGRFLQRDPAGVAGGIHLYRYAENDPVDEIDPSGLQTVYHKMIYVALLKKYPGQKEALLAIMRAVPNTGNFEAFAAMNGVDIAALRQIYLTKFAGAGARFFGSHAAVAVTETATAAAAETVGVAVTETAATAAAETVGAGTARAAGSLIGRVGVRAGALLRPAAALAGRAVVAIGWGWMAWDMGQLIGSGLRYIPGVDSGTQWGWTKLNDWTGGWLFGTPPAAELGTPVVSSHDPNDLLGPAGSGSTHWVTADQTLSYTIRFENDKNATAPAQGVYITQQLDPNLDWTTFELVGFGFGNVTIEVPPGLTFYTARLDLRETLGLFVDISGELDLETGAATWKFLSIDPVTGRPPRDPFSGFLPPNTNSPMGEGFVRYTARARGDAGIGVPVRAQASIVFDTNEAIPTNVHVNPIGPITDCNGDCNGDGSVTIDELIKGVNIALEYLPVESCVPFDTNADGTVTIDEIIAAVNRALNGCPLARPPATPEPAETRRLGLRAIVSPTTTCTPTRTPIPDLAHRHSNADAYQDPGALSYTTNVNDDAYRPAPP